MRTSLHLELVTPEAFLFAGEVDEISMRADSGEIAFPANHEDYFGSDEVRTEFVAVHGGVGDADDGQVTILADIAELGGEIDDRARRALSAEREHLVAEGPATRSTTDDQRNESASPTHLSGAMVAPLVPGSAEAVATRATVRLEAAGPASTS